MIPSREIIRLPILFAWYYTIREIQRNLLNKADVFGLSGSGDGATVKNKPFMNKITHGTHHPVDVSDILIELAIWKDISQIIPILSAIV